MKRCIKAPVAERIAKRLVVPNNNGYDSGEPEEQLLFVKQALSSITAPDAVSEYVKQAQLKCIDRPNLQTPSGKDALKQNTNETVQTNSAVVVCLDERLPIHINNKPTTERWSREDVLNALNLEKQFNSEISLFLSFPDPELDCDIISRYSSNIKTVHPHSNFLRRSCVVHLKEGVDVSKTIEELSKIPFGKGFISAELLPTPLACISQNDDINPCALHLDNLSSNLSLSIIKNHFPYARRYDIFSSNEIENAKCAHIHYNNANTAMEAYKRSVNSMIQFHLLLVRFKRISDDIGIKTNSKQAENIEAIKNNTNRLNEVFNEPITGIDYYEAASTFQSFSEKNDNNEHNDAINNDMDILTEIKIEEEEDFLYRSDIKKEFDKDAFVDDLYRQVSAISNDISDDSSSASNDDGSE